MHEERKSPMVLAAVLLGLFLFAGLATGGYCIGNGALRFRSDIRTVTVKGLVEKEVQADQAVWTLTFKQASPQLQEARARINADREVVRAFLYKQGFKDSEIRQQPTSTIDKRTLQYGQNQENDPLRYIVSCAFVVTTGNIALVEQSQGATEQLLERGVALDTQNDGNGANPRYSVTNFNELRPVLLAEATKNARVTAQQFAADADSRVGKIRNASQGVFQIFGGATGNDESTPYSSSTSSPVKKIRVVSTLEFELL